MDQDSVIQSGPVERNVSVATSILSSFMTQVYMWMAGGLLLTAAVALGLTFATESNPSLQATVLTMALPLFFVELALVWFISARAGKMSVAVSAMLFFAYALINGLVFGAILPAYEFTTVGYAFGATFLTFGAMAIYGYTTKQDLTKFGSIAFMFLIGAIIASIVNIFVASSALDWLLTYVLLGVFIILTAYDNQKLKKLAADAEAQNMDVSKFAVAGALTLYLDFINLFLLILKIMGGSRN